ncbi:MAG: protein-export membrane protein SecD [Candidatus Magasanikbacteria bacterium RIFCSPLOWO2_12_FULL_47_9b]|nr:MAG: protein-export membrane protein SecD [Candidatus Magasanikbacteria bacterium RIFCSPLOWO2_12_FULL_47_9b]
MTKHSGQSHVRTKIRWGILGIFALLGVAFSFDFPEFVNTQIQAANRMLPLAIPSISGKPFSLGLDLQGGAHLIYKADVNQFADEERGDALEGVRDVIERRVNAFGIGESNVQTTKVGDEHRLVVELPGVTDVQAAIAMIGETPILEFKEENTVPPRELTGEEQQQIIEYNSDAKKRASDLLFKIQSGESFDALAKESSEDQQSKNNNGYVGFIGDTPQYEGIVEVLAKLQEGEIPKTVVESPEGYNIVRLGKTRDGETKVEASHVLICFLGAEKCADPKYTKEEAEQKAKELFEQANADNFSDLAKEFSTEPGAEETGGALGVFGKGLFTPAFEDAAFQAKVGEIIGPILTEFGYHIIYKTNEAPTKEYELSRILIRTLAPENILPPPDPWMNTGLSGKQLDRAEIVSDQQTGQIQVSLQFDEEGTTLFADITKRNVGKPVAIFLDGEPISIPRVQQSITSGQAVITGNFTLEDARVLSQRLNAGALPVPVELISQQSVGATLGAESLQKSLMAGIIGVLLVMLFMVLYYRFPGLLSVIALCVYVFFTLALFKFVGVTLTLAGIGGFILSIGMAVDANVLIFERLKEELQDGKSLKAAIEEGFLRAWPSIRDGNLSTLITCLVLMWFGSGFVQGFAITLFIGILTSMFSAITVTRVMLRFVAPWFRAGTWFFLGAKNKDI